MPLSKDYETCMRSEQSDLRQQMPRRMRVSTSNNFYVKIHTMIKPVYARVSILDKFI